MRKKLIAAALGAGLAVSAVMPAAVFAEEQTTAEAGTFVGEENETEEETTEEAYDYSADYEDSGFFRGITALDYVTLPVYTGVSLPDTDVVPSDEDIQTKIDEMLSGYSTTENLTAGTVKDGDTVNIDYVGSIDGVEFEGGSTDGEGTDVTIGVTQYIDDFLEQLIGHKPGETFDVEVTFPEDYGKEELNGKDAVFVTTINHIVNTIVPELDDAFAKENLEFETADAYRQSIYDDLYKQNLYSALLEYLLENAEISEIPEEATDTIYNYQREYIRRICEIYGGMEVDDFLAYQGMTADDLRAQCQEYAKQMMILQAVMEDASLEVTPELVMDTVDATQEDYDQFVEFYGLGYVNSCVIGDCVVQFMAESADVYETEEETEEDTQESETESSETETEEDTTEAETESAAE